MRREGEDLPAPLDRLVLEVGRGDDGVHEPPVEAWAASYWRQRNQISLARLSPMVRASRPGPVAAVEAAHLRPGLAETGVVGGDGQVADQVKDVSAADGVAGDHGYDRLGQPADLDLQVQDVEPPDAATGHLVVAQVAVLAPELWSPPEQKASGPWPVRTTTPMSGSSRASVECPLSSNSVWGRKALRTSGGRSSTWRCRPPSRRRCPCSRPCSSIPRRSSAAR